MRLRKVTYKFYKGVAYRPTKTGFYVPVLRKTFASETQMKKSVNRWTEGQQTRDLKHIKGW